MAQESRNKYLIKNTAIFALGNMGTRLINFFMVPLYTYVLTTEQYGTINSIQSACMIILPLIMCNISEAIRRYLLDKQADEGGILAAEIFWIGFGIVASLAMFGILSLIPAFSAYAREMSLYVLTCTLAGTVMEYLRGKEKLILYTACGLLQTVIAVGLNLLLLVRFRYGVRGYFWSYIAAYSISALIAFVGGGQIVALRKVRFDKALFKEMSKYALTLVPNSMMWWVTGTSDKLMITYMISAAANGIYSVSTKLPTMMETLNQILMQAWQYSAIKESDSQDRVEYHNQMFHLYMSTLSLVCAGLLFINRPFMRIYASDAFGEAWRYCPFLVVASLFSTLANFVGTSYFVEKDMKGNLKSATVGAITNIILNIILIPTMGITGAAITTCFSHVAVLIFRLKDTYKYLPLKAVTPYSLKLLAVIVYMLAVSYIDSLVGILLLGIGVVAIMVITRKVFGGIVTAIYRKMLRKGGNGEIG